jgi:LemA protein
MKRAILLTLAVFFAFGLSGCSYNDLTAKQQKIKSSWANVESNLQRRGDLIGNLAEAAKMAGVQEQEVFGKIADARSTLLNAQQATPQGTDGDKTPEQRQAVLEANSGLGAALGRLLVLQENYPVLRSNESFLKLQDELAGTENRINVARIDYNKAVEDYNILRNSFPTVLTASMLGFKEEPYFKADPAKTEVPKLNADDLRKKENPPTQPAPATNTANNSATSNANK